MNFLNSFSPVFLLCKKPVLYIYSLSICLCLSYTHYLSIHRGHGESDGKPAYLDDWKNYLSDLDTVRSTLLPSKKLPTFLLGHSTGALITIDYLFSTIRDDDDDSNNSSSNNTVLRGDDAIKGVILTGPYIQPATKLNPVKIYVAKLFGSILPNLKIPSDLKVEQLSSDPQKQREHMEDEKILNNATAGWASQCLDAQERVRNMVETTATSTAAATTTLPFPVLYVYGESDTVASPEVNERFSELLQAVNKTVIKRKGEQHEVLNEVNRKELFETISKWILLMMKGGYEEFALSQ